jgi:ABC-2 type transport system permease protein
MVQVSLRALHVVDADRCDGVERAARRAGRDLHPRHLSAADRATTDAVRLSLAGLHLSQIAVGVLVALVVTSEYGTGMIRSSLAAVPTRRLMLAGKGIVFAAASYLVGTASCLAAYYIFQAQLPSGDSLRTSISDPDVARAVLGGGLYLLVLGLLGLGLGTILRSSAATIATLFGLLFVPMILIELLPHSWQGSVGPYLPMQAGSQIFIATHHDANSLSAWTGFAVFSLYAAAALVAGFALINHRDT